MKKKRYICFFLSLFLVSSGAIYLRLSPKEEGPQKMNLEMHLKVVNFEGRVLSGFIISDGNEDLGRTDSFGEWTLLNYEVENLEPFFLTVRSSRISNPIAKRVKVTFEKTNTRGFFFSEVITIPRKESPGYEFYSTFEREIFLAQDIRKAFTQIHVNYNKKHLDKGIDFERIKLSLFDEAHSQGIETSLEAKWQLFLDPERYFEGKESPFIHLTAKLPYDNKRLEFSYRVEKNSNNFAKKVFKTLRERIHYPYLIEKRDDKWFVSAGEQEQKSFWKVEENLELQGYFHNVKVLKPFSQEKEGSLFSISHSSENLCQLPDRNYCFLYKKPPFQGQ